MGNSVLIMEIIKYIGSATLSGVTWDAIKAIPNAFSKFCDHFKGQTAKCLKKLYSRLENNVSDGSDILEEIEIAAKESGMDLSGQEIFDELVKWINEMITVYKDKSVNISVKNNKLSKNSKMIVANSINIGELN